MEKDIKVKNLQLYCRTCLAECNGFKYEVEQLPRPLFQLFRQATNFAKSKNGLFPKWICDSCFYKINNFAEFRNMTKKSTQFLEELVRSYTTQNSSKTALTTAEQKQLDEESSMKSSEVLQINDDQIESTEALQKESCFENIFLEVEIKEDHLELVQPLMRTTDALSIINAESSNTNDTNDLHAINIKIEEKEKNDEDVFKAHANIDREQRFHQCHSCDRSFSTKRHLKEHYNEVHADKSSDENLSLLPKFEKSTKKKSCRVCKQSFVSSSTLEEHMLSHDEIAEKPHFQCDQCQRAFKRKHSLSKHIQESHTDNPLEMSCKFGCGKTFLRPQTAIAHYKSKLCPKAEETKDTQEETQEQSDDGMQNLPAIKKTTCKICFNDYSSEQKLKAHMRLHEEKRRFQCNQCERNFNEKYRLKQHIAESHTKDLVDIPCQFGCGKTFRHLETAKKHYYLKHSSIEKDVKAKSYTFVCEHCGRMFKNVTTLREHNYTHLPPEDRPYKCDECNKSFTSKRSYKDHQTRHMGIKKFECPHCGLKKTTRKELKYHLNIHTKEKLFPCSICAKVFNRQSGLKMHERVVHQGIRKYSCSYCDLSFGKPDTLKNHEMRHTGEKPHKCQNCDRRFIQVVALRAHMKTHNK